jgi:hypothetical protein
VWLSALGDDQEGVTVPVQLRSTRNGSES